MHCDIKTLKNKTSSIHQIKLFKSCSNNVLWHLIKDWAISLVKFLDCDKPIKLAKEIISWNDFYVWNNRSNEIDSSGQLINYLQLRGYY